MFTSLFLVLLIKMLVNSAWPDPYQQNDEVNDPQTEVDSMMEAELWNEALKILLLQNPIQEGREKREINHKALNQIVECYLQVELNEEAGTYLNYILSEEFMEHMIDSAQLAKTYVLLGKNFWELGKVDSANLAYRRAQDIFHTFRNPLSVELRDVCYRIARYNYDREKFPSAIQHYQKYTRYFLDKGDSTNFELGDAYFRLGISYRLIGASQLARHFLRQSIEVSRHHGEEGREQMAWSINSLANTHFDLEDFAGAKPLYIQSLQLRDSADNSDLIIPTANLASTYLYLKDLDSADILFNRAFSLIDGYAGSDRSVEAQCLVQYGEYLLAKDQTDQARSVFERALKIFNSNPQYTALPRARCLRLLSEVEEAQGFYEKAIAQLQKGILILSDGFDRTDPSVNPQIESILNPDEIYPFISSKGNLFYKQFLAKDDTTFLAKAIHQFETLDQITDLLRNSPISDDVKLYIAKYFKRDAANALKCLSTKYDLDPRPELAKLALSFMEKNRYAELFKNLRKAETIAGSGIPDDLLEREREIIAGIDDLEFTMSVVAPREKDSFQILIDELAHQHHVLIQDISNLFPSYGHIQFDSLDELPSIQRRLDSSTQVLEYLWGDTILYVIGFTAKDVDFIQIDLNILDAVLDPCLTWFGTSQIMRTQENTDKLADHLNQLFGLLVRPVLRPDIKRLIISPDGRLNSLPFEALLTDKPTGSFETHPYLISQVEMHYVYSCNLLLQHQRDEEPENPSLLAFSYSSRKSIKHSQAAVMELPESIEEVNAVRKAFGSGNSRVFRGAQATESTFKELAPQYDILHLAVHGLGDTTNAMYSHLMFKTDKDVENDGKLYAHEIYNLDLHQLRFTVLSACETGIGKSFEGEGVFSIARAFAYSGCPSIVMSLWPVDDKSTAEVMKLLYKGLSDGLNISAAMRQAKLTYIEQCDNGRLASPFYWAGLVPLGAVTPVTSSISAGNTIWLISGLAMMMLVILSFALFKKWR